MTYNNTYRSKAGQFSHGHDGVRKMTVFTREEKKVITEAKKILLSKSRSNEIAFESPQIVKDYLQLKYAAEENEIFAIVMVDTKHRLIGYKKLFNGTIDGASVYPREVVKVCLKHNAAACFISHNHPSGVVEPSNADVILTEKLKESLALVDVRLLDHFIVGFDGVYSFVESGKL